MLWFDAQCWSLRMLKEQLVLHSHRSKLHFLLHTWHLVCNSKTTMHKLQLEGLEHPMQTDQGHH